MDLENCALVEVEHAISVNHEWREKQNEFQLMIVVIENDFSF